MMARPDPITLQEAAQRLGVHYMTAYRYVRTGRLAAKREGARWIVDAADVEQLRAPTLRPRRGQARVEARSRLEDRLVAGDEAGAWAVVEAGLASGMDAADVHLDLLVPALRSIGDGWEAGRLTIADEHRASAVAGRVIGRLGPRFARRGRKRGTVLVGAPANEEHALPSAILSDLLRGAGFEVIDLGADTPAESFAETARGANRLVAVLIAITGSGHERACARRCRPSGPRGWRCRSSRAAPPSRTRPTPGGSGRTGGRATTAARRWPRSNTLPAEVAAAVSSCASAKK